MASWCAGDATTAAVGDQLIVRTRAASGLRVYRADGALVGRCPNGPGCTTANDSGQSLAVRLEAPIQHYVIHITGGTDDLSGETMDAFLDAARAAKARIETRRIEVQ